jgi:hypothetical protein
MKTAQLVVAVLALILFSGCPMKKELEGLRITFKPAASETLQKNLVSMLLAKGFIGGLEDSSTGRMSFILGREPTANPRLLAFFSHYETSSTFLIGKAASDFTDAEVAIIDECSAVIASHADLIISGSLSKGASTPALRAKFYAKIKKA